MIFKNLFGNTKQKGPCSNPTVVCWQESETARLDERLVMARESFLVGQLVSGSDDDVAIQRLQSV